LLCLAGKIHKINTINTISPDKSKIEKEKEVNVTHITNNTSQNKSPNKVKSPLFKSCLKPTSNVPNSYRQITHNNDSKVTLNSSNFKTIDMSLHNNSQFNTSSQNKSNINNSNTFNSNTIEKSFSDVNYEAKIQSLNGNVFKLSERLEKNMRKMASKEKELLFSNKKLKETEILNMRLMNELSLKNQSLENLNKDFLKKHHDIEKKRLNSRIQNNDNKLDINPSNLFVKNLTDRIRKEYSKLANPNSKKKIILILKMLK